MELSTLAVNFIRQAYEDGFVAGEPFAKRYQVLGPANGYFDPIKRTVAVSDVDPGLRVGSDVLIWVKIPEAIVYKSSNAVNPSSPKWIPLGTFGQVFFDDELGLTSSYAGSGDTPAEDPSQATKDYITNTLASLMSSGVLQAAHAPVQNFEELRAIDTSSTPDKQFIFVEDVAQMYAFDAQGTGYDNNNELIVPTTGPGTWNVTGPVVLNSGTF